MLATKRGGRRWWPICTRGPRVAAGLVRVFFVHCTSPVAGGRARTNTGLHNTFLSTKILSKFCIAPSHSSSATSPSRHLEAPVTNTMQALMAAHLQASDPRLAAAARIPVSTFLRALKLPSGLVPSYIPHLLAPDLVSPPSSTPPRTLNAPPPPPVQPVSAIDTVSPGISIKSRSSATAVKATKSTPPPAPPSRPRSARAAAVAATAANAANAASNAATDADSTSSVKPPATAATTLPLKRRARPAAVTSGSDSALQLASKRSRTNAPSTAAATAPSPNPTRVPGRSPVSHSVNPDAAK